jgi:hypothetical protein
MQEAAPLRVEVARPLFYYVDKWMGSAPMHAGLPKYIAWQSAGIVRPTRNKNNSTEEPSFSADTTPTTYVLAKENAAFI